MHPHVDADDPGELPLRVEEWRVRAHVAPQSFLHRAIVDGRLVIQQGVTQRRVRRVVRLQDRIRRQVVLHGAIQVVRTEHEVDLVVLQDRRVDVDDVCRRLVEAHQRREQFEMLRAAGLRIGLHRSMRVAVDLNGRNACQLQQLRLNGAQLSVASLVPGVEQAERGNSQDCAAGQNAVQHRSVGAPP
jgi:hypothetical protein